MTTVLILIAFGTLSLLIPHPPNAGARRSIRRWRCSVVAAGLAFAALGYRSPVLGQVLPDISESVVVTATVSPEEESKIGSAATVITRRQIEESGATTVLEVLRIVPGLDVIRSGSDGAVTSVFLRGANSTHTLVLVDGVRINSPFFSGYDFSAMTTENVERIEVVRGPFSALYGSDALGGVVQIFTRDAAPGFSGRGTLEGGSAGQRQGSFFASGGGDLLSAAASYRDAAVDGERPNSDWHERNGSMRLETHVGESFAAALEASILDGKAGNPGPEGQVSPSQARGGFREERVAIPITFKPAASHQTTFVMAQVTSKPTYADPGSSPSFASTSDTNARNLQARVTDTWKTGGHTLAALASWERWTVSADSSFGGFTQSALDGDRSTIWGTGVQDSFQFGGHWSTCVGVRYDHHSAFGSHMSPRATLSRLSAGSEWKLRLSAGTAFRAPSVGELYYTDFGNPKLDPERSTSLEFGLERYLGHGRAEVSVFWNDFRDLIVADPLNSTNVNLDRARTQGIELAWRQQMGKAWSLDTGYAYLDSEDRSTRRELLRRARHRAYLESVLRPSKRLLITTRATFVGRRDDLDGLTFERTVSPSYVRHDLFARYDLHRVAPFVRLENVTDRRYAEVDAFPAPGRRIAAGLEVSF